MSPTNAATEIFSERLIAASPDRVWRAFGEPAQLTQWWGPRGFANTFHEFDLRAAGSWRFTMTGPDGATFEQTRTFIEVSEPRRIVLENADPDHRFRMTIALEPNAGGTRLTWNMVFDDAAEFARVKDFIAAANEENFDRLETLLGAAS